MTTSDLRKLALLLPPGCQYPLGSAAPASRYERIPLCLQDPGFPWNFVKAIIEAGQKLPVDARFPTIVRAYRWKTKGSNDDELAEAYSLTHPANKAMRELLNALLICKALSLERIAQLLSLPLEVIVAYEGLFFNVRDRLTDDYFLSRLVFPETRLADFEDPNRLVSTGQRLLQAAYTHGEDEVFWLAGLQSKAGGIRAKDAYGEFENHLLMHGLTGARHGYLNRNSGPGMHLLKSLVMAHKRDSGQAIPEAGNGLGSSELSVMMAREILKAGNSEVKAALALEEQIE